MRRFPNIVCAVSFLVAAFTTVASDNSFDSLVSYEDRRVARFLKAQGTNCASSASVQCILRGTNGLPCENNVKVKRSDCKAMKNKIPVKAKVIWTYCNKDTETQTQYPDLVVAKYKKRRLQKYELNLSKIAANKCRTYRRNKKINFCKLGAVMSLKYEGTIESRDDSYCFAFKFLRVRKEWLPEDIGACGTTTAVRCKVRGGDKDGEDCAGNILKSDDGSCKQIDVKFQYEYCNWNPTEGTNIKFDRKKTWVKLREVKQSPMNRTMLRSKEKCRIKVVDDTIDTCDIDTIAEMKVSGTVSGDTDQTCESKSELIVVPTERCDYKFIMTEIVVDRDNQGSFIEIYSPNCANKIVTDDFQLIRYGGGTGKAKSDVTNLKSMLIDPCGFIVLCFSSEANGLYGQGTCNYVTGYQSPADSELKDSIAIIEGNIDGDYTIIDAFGNITLGDEGPIKQTDQNRAVRKSIRGNQTYPYKDNYWRIKSPENIDPGRWYEIGVECSPVPRPPISSPSTSTTSSVSPSVVISVNPSATVTVGPVPGSTPARAPSPNPFMVTQASTSIPTSRTSTTTSTSNIPTTPRSPSHNDDNPNLNPSNNGNNSPVAGQGSQAPSKSSKAREGEGSKAPSRSSKAGEGPGSKAPSKGSKAPGKGSKAPGKGSSNAPRVVGDGRKVGKGSKAPSNAPRVVGDGSKAGKDSNEPNTGKASKASNVINTGSTTTSASPTRSASPTTSDTQTDTCYNSPYKFSSNDGNITKRWCKIRFCGNPDADTHCPLTCEKCPMECVDSSALIFRTPTETFTCQEIVALSGCDKEVRKSCRATCGLCTP